MARVLGGALLSLGVVGIAARGMPGRGLTIAYIVYDMATVGMLASAGISGTASGRLLWPVVAVHLLLAFALVIAWLRASCRACYVRAPPTSPTAQVSRNHERISPG